MYDFLNLLWEPGSWVISFAFLIVEKLLGVPYRALTSFSFALEFALAVAGGLTLHLRNRGTPFANWLPWQRLGAAASGVFLLYLVFSDSGDPNDRGDANNVWSWISLLQKIERIQAWWDLAVTRPFLAFFAVALVLALVVLAVIWLEKYLRRLFYRFIDKIAVYVDPL
jgi:hypothetical protein